MTEPKKYRPSNGTEGEIFMNNYCDHCIHEKWSHTQCHGDKQCDILSTAFITGEYVPEWIYNENGKPTCTAYQYWNWGNDNDGWNEPEEPIPVSPNQLCLPFIFEELEKQQTIHKQYA